MTTTEHITACPLDCPDTCTLSVTVTDGAVTAVDAAPGNPFTAGFICQKVKHQARRVHAPERIHTPMLRTGPKGSGSFRSISWDDALDLVEAQMRTAIAEHGAESIVPFLYNASAGTMQGELTERFFRRLGATEVDVTICALTHYLAYASIYGDMHSSDPFDLEHARLIVLWGANPNVTNTHLGPHIVNARRHGAKVVVVDPRRTAAAKRADAHLAVLPGTDVVLALAVTRELEVTGGIDAAFVAANVVGAEAYLDRARPWTLDRAAEVCGVSAEAIAALAHDLATIRPATIRPGWGLERNRNGGSACAAVMALPALTGQFGVPGAGLLVSLGTAAPLHPGRRPSEERHDPAPRHVNMNEVGRFLVDPAVSPPAKVLFVQGANPVVMNPNANAVIAGLARDDLFVVVHEQVMTDTAQWADLVLPAATHFEYDDLASSYGSFTMQPVRAVIPPVGEAISNHELAVRLAARFGFDGPRFPHDIDEFLVSVVADGGDPAATRVLREPGTTVQFRDTAPPDGRARLDHVLAQGLPRYEAIDETFPLVLVTPASPKMINSIFGEFNDPDPTVRLHPDDADARGLVDGRAVTVRNDLGTVAAVVRVDPDQRPGVAAMTKGVWWRSMPDGVGVNVLVPDTLSDLGGGACFNDTRVEVEAR